MPAGAAGMHGALVYKDFTNVNPSEEGVETAEGMGPLAASVTLGPCAARGAGAIQECRHPNRVCIPQYAATAKLAMNATPIARPETVFLLHPWSTATSQTKKRIIATTARPLSHMTASSSEYATSMSRGRKKQ